MANSTTLQQLTHDLHKIVYMLDKRADALLANNNQLSFSQFRILFMIEHKGHTSQSSIAKMYDVSPPAISRQISLLQKKEFIDLAIGSVPRANIFSLTTLGKKELQKSIKQFSSSFEKVYAVLTESERSTLEKLLGKLVHQLHALK